MKYERLTENGKLKDCCYTGGGFVNILLLKDRLAELEDKIEDGTLVELPCKVGGIVYRIIGMPWRIEEQRVDCITISCDGKYEILNDGGDELEIDTLYRTKAEAEARLKELTEKE